MYHPSPSPPPSSLAERIAWMHEPVRLSSVRLPWFVRWYFEAVLHRMFCTLEQGILTLLELQRQGKLEPWPDQFDGTPGPRTSRYRMKANPAAPQRSAGPKAVPSEVDTATLADEPGDEAAVDDAVDGDAADAQAAESEPAAAIAIRALPRQALSHGGTSVWGHGVWRNRWRQSYWVDCAMPPGRCKDANFSSAGWARRENCAQIVPITQRLLILTI